VCCSVLQCVAVFCSVLRYVAACQCVAVCHPGSEYHSLVQLEIRYVAVCCGVLKYVEVCCSVSTRVAVPFVGATWHQVCCSVLQYVAVRCSVLQCVAVCCSTLQCVAVCLLESEYHSLVQLNTLVEACCSVLQWHAVCCNKLQCVTQGQSIVSATWHQVCCSALQCIAACLPGIFQVKPFYKFILIAPR